MLKSVCPLLHCGGASAWKCTVPSWASPGHSVLKSAFQGTVLYSIPLIGQRVASMTISGCFRCSNKSGRCCRSCRAAHFRHRWAISILRRIRSATAGQRRIAMGSRQPIPEPDHRRLIGAAEVSSELSDRDGNRLTAFEFHLGGAPDGN